MSAIFIAYRRQDSEKEAIRISKIMADHFGSNNVFIDRENIKAGEKFWGKIEAALQSCRFFLLIIGEHWLTAKNDNGNLRLNDDDDWHRREIEIAITRKITIIPILIGETQLPSKHNLPPALRPLLKHNAVSLKSRGYKAEIEHLVNSIENKWNTQSAKFLELSLAIGKVFARRHTEIRFSNIVITFTVEPYGYMQAELLNVNMGELQKNIQELIQQLGFTIAACGTEKPFTANLIKRWTLSDALSIPNMVSELFRLITIFEGRDIEEIDIKIIEA